MPRWNAAHHWHNRGVRVCAHYVPTSDRVIVLVDEDADHVTEVPAAEVKTEADADRIVHTHVLAWLQRQTEWATALLGGLPCSPD